MDPTTVIVGTQLPSRELTLTGDHDLRRVLALASQLEEIGTGSLWVGESVVARPRPDALVVLAGVAASTSAVPLGTSVVLPALRNPVAFAHQTATLDQLAGGRLTLGVGVGFPTPGTETEFAALGADHRRRSSGLDASIEAVRALWAGSAIAAPIDDPTGRFGFRDVAISPPPTRPSGPPMWLASGSPAGLERCGRHYDGWLPYPPDPDDYRRGLEQVRRSAAAAGRDPAEIVAGLYVTVAVGADAGSRADDYCHRYYGLGREHVGLVQAIVTGSAAQVAERVATYVDAGARHLVVRHATLDPSQLLDEAAELRDALSPG